MASVGVRELRQRASELLRRVAAGETIEVTDRGRPVALLSPLPEAGPLESLRAAGEVTAPAADVADLPARMGDLTVVDPPVVEHFHRLRIPVHVWTVDEEEEMRALLEIGVDGIVTDRPDVLARVLGR